MVIQGLRYLLFPLTIGSIQLRNRLVMLPITTGYGATDGSVSQRQVDFFDARARGGAGLIIVPFCPLRTGSPLEMGMYDDRFVAPARTLTDALHRRGAKVSAQLTLSYHLALSDGVPEIVGPSPVMNGLLRVIPRELTIDEIHLIVAEYGRAAARARMAGFDLVEIMAGAGYLLNRFLSPLTNQRRDSYGGSLRGRLRVVLEVLESIQRAAGADYPVMVRLNLHEHMEGGNDIEDALVMAKTLEEAGVAGFTSYTGWHESPVPTVQASVPEAAFVHLTEKLKNIVGVPVVAANRINDPFAAELILAEEKADLIGMGRALVADPDLLEKALQGRSDEIVPCLGCSNCLSAVLRTFKEWGQSASMSCAVNPAAGNEADSLIGPALKPRRVLVIGGGPSGLEAARVSAQGGHDVTLYEKESEPGGRLLLAAVPPYKEEMRRLASSLAVGALRAGVKLRLGEEAGQETVERENPDVLIVAVGAVPLKLDIPGADGENVVLAEDVLMGRSTVCGSVIVIGGGLVGCETAEYILQRLNGVTSVTVVEMLDRVAGDVSPTYRPFLLARLRQQGIRFVTGAKVVEIGPRGAVVETKAGSELYEGDSVAIAVGYAVNRGATERFTGLAAETHFIGDCASPRKIKEAMEEGYAAGRCI